MGCFTLIDMFEKEIMLIGVSIKRDLYWLDVRVRLLKDPFNVIDDQHNHLHIT